MERYVIQVRDVGDNIRRALRQRQISVVELNPASVLAAQLLGKWAVWNAPDRRHGDIGIMRRGFFHAIPIRSGRKSIIKRIMKQWRVAPSGFAAAMDEARALCDALNVKPQTIDTQVSDTHLI